MPSFLDRWARQLIRRGLRAGLIEGSNLWLSIGAVVWLLRFLTRRPAPVVSVERLRLGESVVVSHVPAPPSSRRTRRKAAAKAAKLARAEEAAGPRPERPQRRARSGTKSPRRRAEGHHEEPEGEPEGPQ